MLWQKSPHHWDCLPKGQAGNCYLVLLLTAEDSEKSHVDDAFTHLSSLDNDAHALSFQWPPSLQSILSMGITWFFFLMVKLILSCLNSLNWSYCLHTEHQTPTEHKILPWSGSSLTTSFPQTLVESQACGTTLTSLLMLRQNTVLLSRPVFIPTQSLGLSYWSSTSQSGTFLWDSSLIIFSRLGNHFFPSSWEGCIILKTLYYNGLLTRVYAETLSDFTMTFSTVPGTKCHRCSSKICLTLHEGLSSKTWGYGVLLVVSFFVLSLCRRKMHTNKFTVKSPSTYTRECRIVGIHCKTQDLATSPGVHNQVSFPYILAFPTYSVKLIPATQLFVFIHSLVSFIRNWW